MNRIQAELPSRVERVRTLVQERGLAGLVIYGDAGQSGNVRYLTNYAPFFGPVIFLLGLDGRSTILVTFDWEIQRAQLASGLEAVQADNDMASLVTRALESLRIPTGAQLGLVGIDVIPHRTYMALDAGRPELIDMGDEFRELRLIKSPLEQGMLRRAAAITDAALDVLPTRARAGMTEIEVAAAIEYEMRRAGAQGFSFSSGIASGSNTERPVSLPTDRQLQHGDLLMVDIGAAFEGYQADVTRTFVVGEANTRQREVYDIVRNTLESTVALARPGIVMAELHRHATGLLAEHDLARYFTHRAGHGIGLETSLEPIDLRRDERELRPGMTFCIEPGVYIPGFGGIKIEDDVIVTESDPEIISHSTHELQVI